MAIKRIIGRRTQRYKKCLRCNRPIDKTLRDDIIYTCGGCGQHHFVDVYPKSIHLTVVEHPEERRRPVAYLTHEQRAARQRLLEKVEAKKNQEAEL